MFLSRLVKAIWKSRESRESVATIKKRLRHHLYVCLMPDLQTQHPQFGESDVIEAIVKKELASRARKKFLEAPTDQSVTLT